MKHFISIALALFCLTGCAKHFDIQDIAATPLQGPVQAHYRAGSGTLEVEDFIVLNRREYSIGTSKVSYSSKESIEGLHWNVTLEGLPRKLKVNMVIVTDKLGVPSSQFVVLADKSAMVTANKSEETQLLLTDFFSSVFIPLAVNQAGQGIAISKRVPLQQLKSDMLGSLSGEATFTGQATYNEVECYVLRYRATSLPFKTASRELVHAVIESDLLLDKQTLTPVAGRSQMQFVAEETKTNHATFITYIKKI